MWNPRSAGKRHATDSAASDRISRGTGIRALSSMPWGTHICVFYETKQDLLDTATAYFEADESLAGQRMIVLCTYSLSASRCVDLLEVARAHKLTIVRRNGEWEFLATPEFKPGAEVRGRSEALDDLSKPFQGHETLTSRERSVLSLIVKGLSSKEIARRLDIAPRTVEFHRANLLKKTGAKSTIDLMHIVLGK